MLMSNHRASILAGVFLVAVPLFVACGDDKEATSTTPAATTTLPVITTAVPATTVARTTLPATTAAPATTTPPVTTAAPATTTTVPMEANVEALSYLIQGLLTTPQIGGGWVDMGRVVVPPGQEPSSTDLCPDGQAIAEPIGTTLNAQVSTHYQRVEGTQPAVPADTSMVWEYLLWNERQQVDDAFATLKAATEACIGKEGATSFDAPALGTSSYTFGSTPVTPPLSDPWIESQGISILMSVPSEPVSLVITVLMTVMHNNPDREVGALDTDELIRIAEAAVNRIIEGL